MKMFADGCVFHYCRNNVLNFVTCRNFCSFTVLFFSFVFICSCTRINTQEFNESMSKSKLLFQYCYSCGYFENFKEYGKFLQQAYPGIVVEGQEFIPSSWCVVLAKVISGIKIISIVCILQHVNFFPSRLRHLWAFCQKHKVIAGGSIFFLCSNCEKIFLSSGAFEIFQNGTQIWSTLQEGRLPELEELLEAIKPKVDIISNAHNYSLNTQNMCFRII